jgi:hypothetical protein
MSKPPRYLDPPAPGRVVPVRTGIFEVEVLEVFRSTIDHFWWNDYSK